MAVENVEGYARLVVDQTGGKYLVEDVWNKTEMLEIDFDFLAEQLGNQLPDLWDVQVVCVFAYECTKHFDYWSGGYEYEDEFVLLSNTVIQQGYKEQWAKDLRSELKHFSNEAPMDEKAIMQDVAEWEEFYGEEFGKQLKE